MQGVSADLAEIGLIVEASRTNADVQTGLCLPATLINPAAEAFPDFEIGGQDCHFAPSGAHTGSISAAMLVDAGAKLTIIGHSERRSAHGETDDLVRSKAIAAHGSGLSAILCIGETEAQRDAGQAVAVVLDQLAGSVPDDARADWLSIAYEPIWAIGTGKVPSIDDVAHMHREIRAALVARFDAEGNAIHILYGGSMNGENALELLAIENVDGGLVGGASLTAEKFAPILAAAQALSRN